MEDDLEKQNGRERIDSSTLHADSEDQHVVPVGHLQLEDTSATTITSPPAVTTKIMDVDDRFNPKSPVEKIQQRLRVIIEHFAFRVFTIFMILFDVIVVIVDFSLYHQFDGTDHSRVLEVLSIIIVSYFMLEVCVRIFAKGPREFFTYWVDALDFVVVLISFILMILYAAGDLSGSASLAKLVVAGRLVRIILILRVIVEKRHLEKSTRLMVSQNKRRYQKDGFDLDLCYITERVIAMSFPSKGLMSVYRNPIREVARFLDTKHPDHYKVFNLCSERMYDETLFHCRVERVRIDDHNVPKLHEMLEFARIANEWMQADSENIIAVHCKGGKGRTGTVICTWLIESGEFTKAEESLGYFGDRRTDLSVGKTFQGVETPSQSRYVGYFERIKKDFGKQLPPPKKLQLSSVTIHGLPAQKTANGNDLTMKVIQPEKAWEYKFGEQKDCKTKYQSSTCTLTVELEDKPTLINDVKVMFFAPGLPRGYDKCSFYFWFYTSFIEGNSLRLGREELDNPHKPSRWAYYLEDFEVELTFTEPT